MAKRKEQIKEPSKVPQVVPEGRVRKGTVTLIAVAALVVGFVAGAVVGGIWEHRLSAPPSTESTAEMPPPAGPPAPTPEQKANLRALEARTQKDPSDVKGWIELGNLNYDLGRAPEAIRAYEKALALKPGDPDVTTDLGTMYRAVGQPQKAVELFREAHRLDPNHFNSAYNEGLVLLHDLNDIPGAAKAWEEYLRLVPQGPQSDRIRAVLQSLREQGKLQ